MGTARTDPRLTLGVVASGNFQHEHTNKEQRRVLAFLAKQMLSVADQLGVSEHTTVTIMYPNPSSHTYAFGIVERRRGRDGVYAGAYANVVYGSVVEAKIGTVTLGADPRNDITTHKVLQLTDVEIPQ